ncbi:chorismate mutase [Streptomyces spectabilis]|uniref:chorismate mutase n=1 Tax=Streptomyces spectabilis TaxID=68270 RepID=A0A7W8ESZ5_STRST|nr:chorismate mutase [Streptomyces spectabilis]MBB5102175.1 chorismate mutase [Streptomyces spectabilis]MCI3907223.1 chorismate mutase [Streptomyces spectabilis]GGV29235.1 chorismate mutase [Streptomyces spectabilis]
MHRTTSTAARLGRALAVGVTAAVLVLGGSGAVAAPAVRTAPAVGAASHAGPYGQLRTLAALSADRLATADLVAAAKYGTGSPIDDPAREQQVLDAVSRQAVEAGGDPESTVRVFRDQIEANKLVQRALHRQWDADPSSAPTERPDLGKVREEINRVNGELVRALAASAPTRTAPYCDGLLTAATAHVRHARGLDTLHATALRRALPSVCG